MLCPSVDALRTLTCSALARRSGALHEPVVPYFHGVGRLFCTHALLSHVWAASRCPRCAARGGSRCSSRNNGESATSARLISVGAAFSRFPVLIGRLRKRHHTLLEPHSLLPPTPDSFCGSLSAASSCPSHPPALVPPCPALLQPTTCLAVLPSRPVSPHPAGQSCTPRHVRGPEVYAADDPALLEHSSLSPVAAVLTACSPSRPLMRAPPAPFLTGRIALGTQPDCLHVERPWLRVSS